LTPPHPTGIKRKADTLAALTQAGHCQSHPSIKLFADPKISQLYYPQILAQQNILRLEISMQDVTVVQVMQGK
jgi:hypothetical protein